VWCFCVNVIGCGRLNLPLQFGSEEGIQLLLVPGPHVNPELLRCLVELEAISAAVDGVEFLLSIGDADGVVLEDILEDSVQLPDDKVDGGAVPAADTEPVVRHGALSLGAASHVAFGHELVRVGEAGGV
jgi:hypothetical protein